MHIFTYYAMLRAQNFDLLFSCYDHVKDLTVLLKYIQNLM